MQRLNVPAMIEPLLENYNQHVSNLMGFLHRRSNGYYLIYDGPDDIRTHFLERTVYACSLYCTPKKIFKDVFPVMIGSDLDFAIRHLEERSFQETTIPKATTPAFETLDAIRGGFVINGYSRHLPYVFTNDPTNTHVVQNKMVRVYAYNSEGKGKELSFYVADTPEHRYGDKVVSHNDGTQSSDDSDFFYHCVYPTDLEAYMLSLFRKGLFDIDHLGNKIVFSPGHLLVKLFLKLLAEPLQEENWPLLKSKVAELTKCIATGDLWCVLSQKIAFFKEGKSGVGREIGANGKVFIEKQTGCFRPLSMQTAPLIPYILWMIIRQVSKRVKHSALEVLPSSYEGFLCILGCFETKNVGRTTMMVRDTIVSTCDALDPLFHDDFSEFWNALGPLEPQKGTHYVVVNEACIPVSRTCFDNVDLLKLKRRFKTIECYVRDQFVLIRYKAGLIMKRLPGSDIWVTPYDEMYWAYRFFNMTDKSDLLRLGGYPSITSYMVDLNPFFNRNGFPKNILGFNALKNAVVAVTSRFVHYFLESVSAYLKRPTSYHRMVMEPVDDGVSKHFVLWVPRVLVTYASFQGCTQEDCIVLRKGVDAFDCFRFYTLRFRVTTASGTIRFQPVRGAGAEGLLGTVVSSNEPILVESFSIHVRVVQPSPNFCHLYFSKSIPFSVVQYFIARDILTVCVEQEHLASTGDKLCSFHGQKGVICIADKVWTFDGTIQPDIVVNAFSLFRMTPGQIHESLGGECRDSQTVRNSDGQLIPGAKAMIGFVLYFLIAYLSGEHFYAPETCVKDRVTGQAVKGRSRGGGMRFGNMESNAARGNGIAACFEEKFFEDGDRVNIPDQPTLALPKSVNLVKEDAKFYKCDIRYETRPALVRVPRKRARQD